MSALRLLAALLISYLVALYPRAALGILCVYLSGSYCLEYWRRRFCNRFLQQITGGKMDSSVPVKDRPGFMIGAWGFKFFESDHDYDIVAHLGADMGLSQYNRDPKMQDSLLNPKDRAFVIKHIQQPTELDRVFKKYLDMLKDYKIIDIKATRNESVMIDSPRYYIFLLGLLAMQLGCTLSRKHRRWMKANWNACLFMYERIYQAKKAAFEYENGKPLKLGSKSLIEMMMTLSDNEQPNVPNNAVLVSAMRMHLDNEIAKGKGATATQGVDISNAFADETNIAAFEQNASEKAKSAMENDNMHETPKAFAPGNGVKITQWAANKAGWDRLQEHLPEEAGVNVDHISEDELVNVLSEFIKNIRTR